ncbi:hypothetical protein Sjap_009951 [Stephania japonica]|uniref:Uncharacterized protein n=1 Tax=Stephania japonica TaxID=461633 RepID=A0AAP0J8H3_9MAGN
MILISICESVAMSGDEGVKMEEANMESSVVLMWGYLPGASPLRTPLLSPTIVRRVNGDTWMDVCWGGGGGCGFTMAISESRELARC